MGTLKDEMRGVSEDQLLCEKAEDGENPGSSDGISVTETLQKNTDEESITREGKPKMDCNKDSKDNDICVKADASNSGERQSISVAVPSTPDPTDPRSPAPFGQQHMRTQVSLEVVQCCSAATSPMTPPEGGHNSFFFPSSFGRAEEVGTDTKDAELQVGQQVEYSSVATSPMTPKTPFFSSFPTLPNRESAQRKTDEGQGCQVGTKNPAESEISGALKLSSSKEVEREDLSSSGAPESPANCSATECKQQRMGSMDQDITILVTQHGNNDEEEEKSPSTACSVEPEMVKLEEEEEEEGPCQDGEKTADECDQKNSKSTIKTQEASAKTELKSANSLEAQDNKDVVPESPAPFGCHNMRTQVSLEVVQCHSAATSPMTPPEGDQAFCFPSTLTKCGAVGTETKDAELQVGQQVEYRSVATAPMTPRTPIATTFPEIQKGVSVEEKIVEEEEGKESFAEKYDEEKEEEAGCEDKEEEAGCEDKEEEAECEDDQSEKKKNEEMNCKEEKCEEPVQEVSWDDKGMTWEVYGAVVEVSVLGSAIQKHLEKQVKKQKKQTSMPPPPPLNPSATPLSTSEASPRGSGSGSGKGRGSKRGEGKPSRRRRNPFRLMMENMQQPHCCSRAHTTE